MHDFDWQTNLEARSHDPDIQAIFFINTLTNIFENFIPFDDIIVKPPWIKKRITLFYNRYRRTFKDYMNQGRPLRLANKIKEMKEHYSKIVADSHTKYLTRLGNKLNNFLSHGT